MGQSRTLMIAIFTMSFAIAAAFLYWLMKAGQISLLAMLGILLFVLMSDVLAFKALLKVFEKRDDG